MREIIFTLHCALTQKFTFILDCTHRIVNVQYSVFGYCLLQIYISNIKLCGLYAVIFLSNNFLIMFFFRIFFFTEL